MSFTDRTAAELCHGIYNYPGDIPVTWDYLDDGLADDMICWGVKRLYDIDIVVFRGSTTTIDWLRNLNAWSTPFHKTKIGRLHPGFIHGMEQVWSEVRERLGPKVIVTGHSLGAARADILCGLMLRDGKPPLARVVFGEPKPGFRDFATLVAKIPGRSYCNGDLKGHDLVTEVPFTFPPQFYVRPTKLIPCTASPPPNDPWGVFRYHHMDLYLKAVWDDPGAGESWNP